MSAARSLSPVPERPILKRSNSRTKQLELSSQMKEVREEFFRRYRWDESHHLRGQEVTHWNQEKHSLVRLPRINTSGFQYNIDDLDLDLRMCDSPT